MKLLPPSAAPMIRNAMHIAMATRDYAAARALMQNHPDIDWRKERATIEREEREAA